MRSLIYFVALLLITSCNAQTGRSTMENLDKHLQAFVDKHKTPSVSYLIFNKDSVLHSFSSGRADVKNNKPVNENTTYAGFSVTKTFTALAIMQLAEKGKLNIDDKAEKYLNDFTYPSEITIRQLLTHTTGIPNPLPLKWVHKPEQSSSFNRNEFFAKIIQENNKVKSAPNEKFAYTNIGYFLLGQIIEKVSGQRYEEYVHDSIISPLGITNEELGFNVNKNQHAKGYQKKFSLMNFLLGFLMDKSQNVETTEGKWISFKDMKINGPSYGGLIGTPKSFMKYVQELLKPNSILLSEEYKKMLFVENKTKSNKNTGMCLSWFKGELNNTTYYTHVGGGAGFYCEIRIYPEKGIGSVLMFNRTGVKDEKILSGVDKYYFEK